MEKKWRITEGKKKHLHSINSLPFLSLVYNNNNHKITLKIKNTQKHKDTKTQNIKNKTQKTQKKKNKITQNHTQKISHTHKKITILEEKRQIREGISSSSRLQLSTNN